MRKGDQLASAQARERTVHAADPPGAPWWRHAVIYQVYPRSFADSDGDGMGDLPGTTARLDHLAHLGVDAVWLSPFYPSPQADAGYDVSDYREVDPLFGRLADFEALVGKAKGLGLRVIIDLVPNHTSDRHPWFLAAVADRPGGPQRARYIFRDGRGPDGSEPPNDWASVFGGPAWTRTVGRASGTCTCSTAASQTSTGTTRRYGPSSRTSCGSGWTVASTGSASTWPTGWSSAATCPTGGASTGPGWPRSTRAGSRRCGTRRAYTTSTGPGGWPWTPTPESGSSWPRRGWSRRTGWPATCGPTRCTRRSTSSTCRHPGAPPRCAR